MLLLFLQLHSILLTCTRTIGVLEPWRAATSHLSASHGSQMFDRSTPHQDGSVLDIRKPCSLSPGVAMNPADSDLFSLLVGATALLLVSSRGSLRLPSPTRDIVETLLSWDEKECQSMA